MAQLLPVEGRTVNGGKDGGDFLITFPQDFFEGAFIGFALLFMLKRERACLMKKIMTIAAVYRALI